MPGFPSRPQAIYNQIKDNLADRYASGFPVPKELIQNAEDAKASLIRFQVHPGWAEAGNPLLRVPGLIVVNDGNFRKEDGEGIMSFSDSRKGADVASIGRFGVGQKAVFHLCDAFLAHAFGHDISFSTVANPCLDVISDSHARIWEEFSSSDCDRLEAQVADLPRGLLLWIPLRRDDILPAPKLSFTDARPTGAELIDEFGRHAAELRQILAAMRHLDLIEAWRGTEPVLRLSRSKGSTRMVGPSNNRAGSSDPERRFAGEIETEGGPKVRYLGAEILHTTRRLAGLKDGPDWPGVTVFTVEGQGIRPREGRSARGGDPGYKGRSGPGVPVYRLGRVPACRHGCPIPAFV